MWFVFFNQNGSRTYETTQLISRVTVNFFKNVSTYVSKVTQMVEEAQRIHEQKLYALEKKYEVGFHYIPSFACNEQLITPFFDGLNFFCRNMLITRKGNY